MTIEMLDPQTLPRSPMYHQGSVASGSRTIYLAGQVARTATGERVGEADFAAQVEQAYLNVAAGLEAAGASFDDVAKLTVYVVDYSLDLIPQLGEGVGRAAARLGGVDLIKPITLIGVAALGEPDLLVEVEAVAVV